MHHDEVARVGIRARCGDRGVFESEESRAGLAASVYAAPASFYGDSVRARGGDGGGFSYAFSAAGVLSRHERIAQRHDMFVDASSARLARCSAGVRRSHEFARAQADRGVDESPEPGGPRDSAHSDRHTPAVTIDQVVDHVLERVRVAIDRDQEFSANQDPLLTCAMLGVPLDPRRNEQLYRAQETSHLMQYLRRYQRRIE